MIMCVCCNHSIQQIPAKIRLQLAAYINIILQALIMFLQPQHVLTYTASMRYGTYYANGHLFSATANIGFRFQPYVNINLNANYNNLILPQPWGNTHFWLIGPRIDVTFTNTLFFTTYIQYNQQQNNININARFQWRYKPASDLFIVYTDNYYPESFGVKTRALVIKLNYWLSL